MPRMADVIEDDLEEVADGLEEIRLFARIGAKAADILVRPNRHRGAKRSKETVPGEEPMG